MKELHQKSTHSITNN